MSHEQYNMVVGFEGDYIPPKDFIILDIETTTKEDGNFRAIDGCKPYLIGVRGELGNDHIEQIIFAPDEKYPSLWLPPFKALVGHNIKFDLEHIRRHKSIVICENPYDEEGMHSYTNLATFIQKKAMVLDTQFITYLHSGHTKVFPSLEDACDYWGVYIHKKTLDLGEELPKVDYDITRITGLSDYLHNDLSMTTLLINAILKDEWVQRNFRWILKMHEGYLASHEIEFNGMHVDPARLIELTDSVQKKHELVTKELKSAVAFADFDPASNDHVAKYLFGGDIETVERVPNGVFASGKRIGAPRYKLVKHTKRFPGVLCPDEEWKSEATGKYSVNEDVLLTINSTFTNKVLEFRELSKLKGTYLEGLGKHLRVVDGKYYVFPQINMCQTATGRTSSSKPNMQNTPTHDSVGVSSIYTSRFGDDGILLEVDFKQIEILALAVLSLDPALRKDILSGVDIHSATGEPVFGPKMTKEQRRVIKTINFGLIYGGSARTLAKQAKVPVAIAARAILSFYNRYPTAQDYFDSFKGNIQRLMDQRGIVPNILKHHEGTAIAQKLLIWESPTGRRYGFKDYPAKRYASDDTIEVSHTETRNYPIQGLATGDLVLVALGAVWRKVLTSFGEDVKMIGLVHDSIRFDIKLDRLQDFVVQLKCTLENAGELLNSAIGKEFWNLPIKVTFSKGTNFFNMEEFDVIT